MVVWASVVAIAFVAPSLTPVVSRGPYAMEYRSPVKHVRLGFLDNFKEAFVNEPKLAEARKKENQKTSSYVQQKVRRRQEYDRQVAAKKEKGAKGEIQTGNAVVDELLSGWTWK